MVTVEDLLKAFALAYDTFLDPESERENPVPEYAGLIRQAVGDENAKLRELVRDYCGALEAIHCSDKDAWQCRECPTYKGERECMATELMDRARSLGVVD